MLTRHDLATTPALLLASALLITGTLQAVPLPNVASGTLLLHLDDTGIDATGGPGGTLQWTDNAGGVVFQLSGPLGTSPTQESVTVNEIARQAVRFPGGDSALTSTTNLQLFATNSDGLTAFVLFDVDSTAGQKFVFNQGVSAPFPGNNFEIGIDTGIGDGDGNFGLHKGHGNATIAPAGTILSDTFTLTTITVLPAGNSPANVTIHQDGTALSVANDNQGYLNAGSYATDLRPIDIGGRNDGATGNFNSLHAGDIVEVVIYQGALTEADRIGVENVLFNVFGSDDLDGDGLLDGWEQQIIDADPNDPITTIQDVLVGDDFDGDGSDNEEEHDRRTDPTDDDSDDDGLKDGVETDTDTWVSAADTGTDPLDDDSDNDGLLDGAENHDLPFAGPTQPGTDPNLPDTDGDGIGDKVELEQGTDPTDELDFPGTILLLHLDETGIDATGGPGGTLRWTDNISGINFDLSGPLGTSPTQESVTVNGIARQAVRFPGGDSALSSTTDFQLFEASDSGLTALVLFDVDSTAGQKFVFNQGVSAPFPGNNFEIGIDTGLGAGEGNFGLHKGHGNATIAPAGTILSDTFTLMTITVLPAGNSPDNVTIHKDGTALSVANDNQGYLNAGSYATDLRPIDIGGRNDGATGNFNSLHAGDIVEVRIYGGALSDAERIAAETQMLSPGAAALGLDVSRDPVSGDLTLTWDSREGRLYNVRSETDPSATDPIDWPIFDGNADLAATPPENTLTFALPADLLRLFVVEEFPAPPVAVLSDDFESGQGDWTVGSDGEVGTAWELGAPSVTGPSNANSPTDCFGTNIAGDYGFDAIVWLRSPPIVLTTAAGATLKFSHYVDIEVGFDSGQVRLLDADNANAELAVLQTEIDGDNPAGWESFTKILPAAAIGKTVVIEFRFSSDDVMNQAGWYIDDVMVTVP